MMAKIAQDIGYQLVQQKTIEKRSGTKKSLNNKIRSWWLVTEMDVLFIGYVLEDIEKATK